jgi:hypothetical protein
MAQKWSLNRVTPSSHPSPSLSSKWECTYWFASFPTNLAVWILGNFDLNPGYVTITEEMVVYMMHIKDKGLFYRPFCNQSCLIGLDTVREVMVSICLPGITPQFSSFPRIPPQVPTKPTTASK